MIMISNLLNTCQFSNHLLWMSMVITALSFAGAQTDSNSCLDAKFDPSYPLVHAPVYDQRLTIGTKIYHTTVVLSPLFSSTFNWRAFYDTAVCYYGGSDHQDCTGCEDQTEVQNPPLAGFLEMEFVEVTIEIPSRPSGNELHLVTYAVSYDISELQNTSGINEKIQDTIGNYQELNAQFGKDSCELSRFYIVNTTKEKFVFEGNNPCGPGSCLGPYMFCSENPNDFSGCCKSICKASFCANDGTCKHNQSHEEPLCFCSSPNPASYWYIGEKCQTFLHMWMIVVPIVLSFLTIVAAIIIACLCYQSKKTKRKKELELEQEKADLAEFNNRAFIAADNELKEDTATPVNHEMRFNQYDYVPGSSITTDRESTERRTNIERYQGRRKSSSSTSETTEPDSEPDAGYSDSWSITTERTVSERNLNDMEDRDVPFQQDRGTSPIPIPKTPPSSKQNNASEKKGLRAGWTPSLGPQTPHHENVPVDLKSFSPDSHV